MKRHTHTYSHTDTAEREKTTPHLADGWRGSRTTHHFSISISSHSAPSLYLPAPINLRSHARLPPTCFIRRRVLSRRALLFLERCAPRKISPRAAQPHAELVFFISLSVYLSGLFLLTRRRATPSITHMQKQRIILISICGLIVQQFKTFSIIPSLFYGTAITIKHH